MRDGVAWLPRQRTGFRLVSGGPNPAGLLSSSGAAVSAVAAAMAVGGPTALVGAGVALFNLAFQAVMAIGAAQWNDKVGYTTRAYHYGWRLVLAEMDLVAKTGARDGKGSSPNPKLRVRGDDRSFRCCVVTRSTTDWINKNREDDRRWYTPPGTAEIPFLDYGKFDRNTFGWPFNKGGGFDPGDEVWLPDLGRRIASPDVWLQTPEGRRSVLSQADLDIIDSIRKPIELNRYDTDAQWGYYFSSYMLWRFFYDNHRELLTWNGWRSEPGTDFSREKQPGMNETNRLGGFGGIASPFLRQDRAGGPELKEVIASTVADAIYDPWMLTPLDPLEWTPNQRAEAGYTRPYTVSHYKPDGSIQAPATIGEVGTPRVLDYYRRIDTAILAQHMATKDMHPAMVAVFKDRMGMPAGVDDDEVADWANQYPDAKPGEYARQKGLGQATMPSQYDAVNPLQNLTIQNLGGVGTSAYFDRMMGGGQTLVQAKVEEKKRTEAAKAEARSASVRAMPKPSLLGRALGIATDTPMIVGVVASLVARKVAPAWKWVPAGTALAYELFVKKGARS